jgi:uncharacterized protein (DUF736 family)
LIWPQDGWRLDRLAAMAAARLSSPGLAPPRKKECAGDAGSPIPREARKSSAAILRCAPALTGASSIACGLSIAIETAVVAGSDSQGVSDMATIGTFKKVGENDFVGEICTLRLNITGVRIVSVTRTNDSAPSHRIQFGRIEIGAAWPKRSSEGRDYLSVKLDDPSLSAPIYANLFEDEGGETFGLIWSRPTRRNGD